MGFPTKNEHFGVEILGETHHFFGNAQMITKYLLKLTWQTPLKISAIPKRKENVFTEANKTSLNSEPKSPFLEWVKPLRNHPYIYKRFGWTVCNVSSIIYDLIHKRGNDPMALGGRVQTICKIKAINRGRNSMVIRMMVTLGIHVLFALPGNTCFFIFQKTHVVSAFSFQRWKLLRLLPHLQLQLLDVMIPSLSV